MLQAFFKRNKSRLIGYSFILFGSLFPAIVRLMISLDLNIIRYDIKDYIFAGLAINLSNFNLIKGHRLETQLVYTTLSVFLIFLLGCILGVFLGFEIIKPAPNLPWLTCFAIILFLGSVYLSYEANNLFFNQEELKL